MISCILLNACNGTSKISVPHYELIVSLSDYKSFQTPAICVVFPHSNCHTTGVV